MKLWAMVGHIHGWMGLMLGPLIFQVADDHHAFHEDAKPGDLSFQLSTRSRSSSNQFVTISYLTSAQVTGSIARRFTYRLGISG